MIYNYMCRYNASSVGIRRERFIKVEEFIFENALGYFLAVLAL
jgi:hypothetical protein